MGTSATNVFRQVDHSGALQAAFQSANSASHRAFRLSLALPYILEQIFVANVAIGTSAQPIEQPKRDRGSQDAS